MRMQLAQLETSLASIPSVSVTASCLVDGELSADVFQGDAVTCRAHVLLSRPSHATAGAPCAPLHLHLSGARYRV